ncbi:NAD+ diphosphatase [Marinobacter pelagius]|uniref:NAD(+) diphosphatase n=2 Tax=Marinobacter pelagius TaxID=379482 RepID=A0A366GYV7_9GAMM|nr:NAD+ diphosphatase [Marinobacter pelagius]
MVAYGAESRPAILGTCRNVVHFSITVFCKATIWMNYSDTDWKSGWTIAGPEPRDLVLLVSGAHILKPEEGWLVSRDDPRLVGIDADAVALGSIRERAVYVTEVPEDTAGFELVNLREAILMREDVPTALVSTGFQVWQWWRDHRFCGRCGGETGFHPRERAKWCDTCHIPWYPRLAPCVIVVIRRNDRFLLAKNARVKRHFYSLIAGFVEPGESLEEAVAREVMEETGLAVTNVRYCESQPWPFPHQLMVGFFADYAGGELVLQEDELSDAGWYRPGDTPPVPPQTTIAGRLIRLMEREIAEAGGTRG